MNVKNLHNQTDARRLAQNIIQSDIARAKQEQEETDKIHEYLSNLKGEDLLNEDGVSELTTMLSLDDSSFALLAPTFLEELERHYNTTSTRTGLLYLLNSNNIRLEDLQEEYEHLCEEIEENFKHSLSSIKRDFIKRYITILYNAISSAEGIAKRVIKIPIEKLSEEIRIPEYAHDTDAGLDIFALEEITINPGETKIIPTGIKVAIPAGYELQVRPKSGRCAKTKLRIANTPGTIDSGYRDEIGIIVENIDPPIRAIHPRTTILDQPGVGEIVRQEPITEGDIEFGQSYTIGKGEKFAQLVLSEVPKVTWLEVDDIHTVGGDRQGGFGSTGLK